MNLNEEIKRIQYMMNVVNENSALYPAIQKIINSKLYELNKYYDDLGFGDAEKMDELDSIKEINVAYIINSEIYINIEVNNNRRNFDNTINALEYEIRKFIPNAVVYINNIVDKRSFGPGIDW